MQVCDFWKFYSLANASYITVQEDVRYGQHLMNELYKVRPDLYNQLPDDADPFYDNSKVSHFMTYLENHWNN